MTQPIALQDLTIDRWNTDIDGTINILLVKDGESFAVVSLSPDLRWKVTHLTSPLRHPVADDRIICAAATLIFHRMFGVDPE